MNTLKDVADNLFEWLVAQVAIEEGLNPEEVIRRFAVHQTGGNTIQIESDRFRITLIEEDTMDEEILLGVNITLDTDRFEKLALAKFTASLMGMLYSHDLVYLGDISVEDMEKRAQL
ncbi:MAG: hypothetical protein JXD19_03530 [Deltaproteobacteria bacterium]|nr:hypothetical protein [Deltaproteobacteria bacterium]